MSEGFTNKKQSLDDEEFRARMADRRFDELVIEGALFDWEVTDYGADEIRQYSVGFRKSTIDAWAKKRKSMLIVGLILCQQAIDNDGVIDREFLEQTNVEPEAVEAVLTMNEVMFGGG